MNRRLLPLIAFALLAPLSSCGESSSGTLARQTPFRIVKEEGAKTTIASANGSPLALCSTEFRSDIMLLGDRSKPGDLEDYFALAKDTGFNVIDLPFLWSEVETEKGVYSFSDIDTFLSLAKKYGLRLNLLWYGSYVDGETHTANMPSYIKEDPSTYKVIKDCFDNSIFGRTMIMDWSSKALLNREAAAVKALLNHVAEWNLENGKYNPIIVLQCGQGLDRLERYRINQYDIRVDGEKMTGDQAKVFVEDYATAISKAAKQSKYAPITRVEFCEQSAITSYVRSVEEISSIDILSTTYLHTVAVSKIGINNFAEEYGDYKPVMNSENWSDDVNYRNALVTYAMGGCGFTSYNLSSPMTYPLETNSGVLFRRKKEGATIAEKFEQVGTRGSDIASVNAIVNKAYVPVAKAKKENFALLGFDSKVIRENDGHQKIYLDSGILFDYKATDENSFGYVMYHGNYLYVISNSAGEIRLSNCFIQSGAKGGFDEDGFFEKEENVSVAGGDFAFEANALYRIRIGEAFDLPSEEELDASGYKASYDAIKG